ELVAEERDRLPLQKQRKSRLSRKRLGSVRRVPPLRAGASRGEVRAGRGATGDRDAARRRAARAGAPIDARPPVRARHRRALRDPHQWRRTRWVAQEALTNSRKHAAAARVEMQLAHDASLTVEDSGVRRPEPIVEGGGYGLGRTAPRYACASACSNQMPARPATSAGPSATKPAFARTLWEARFSCVVRARNLRTPCSDAASRHSSRTQAVATPRPATRSATR